MIWYLIWVLLWMTVGHLFGVVVMTLLIIRHMIVNALDWDNYHECWREILDSKYDNFDYTKFISYVLWSAWALVWPVKLIVMWLDVIPSADRLYHERFNKEEA